MPPTGYNNWLAQTAVARTMRSAALKTLDKEVHRIEDERPDWRRVGENNDWVRALRKRLKIALNAYIAATPNWDTGPRNRTRAITRLRDDVERVHPTAAVKHAAYTVPRTPHVAGTPVVPYGNQSKMMNCWWQCAKMALDYHVGKAKRREVMKASPAAKRVYDANNGIRWDSEDGLATVRELNLLRVTLPDQGRKWFSTEGVRTGLVNNGPLLFGGVFCRHFGVRLTGYRHVILVYGVEYDRVLYHDPALGIAAARSEIWLDWPEFKNGWGELASQELLVHAVNPEWVARVRVEAAAMRAAPPPAAPALAWD